jgi:hypothetical protein
LAPLKWGAWVAVCAAIAACSGSTLSLQAADGGGNDSGSTGMGNGSGTGLSSGSSGMGSSSDSSGTETGSGNFATMGSDSSSGVSMSSGSSSRVTGSDAASGSGLADAAVHDATAPDSATKITDAGSDATREGTAGDADAAPCAACGAGSVCVEDLVLGGELILPDDAGQCPNGRVVVPQSPRSCTVPPTYRCLPVPAECTSGTPAPTHCACVPSICPAGLYMCTDLTLTLTQCIEAVP